MGDARETEKAPEAFRTISEVAEDLDLPQHVLRFWETRFVQIRPVKRGGGRRFYRPEDVDLLRGIRHLLYGDGYTIKGVQKILKEQGIRHVQDLGIEREAAEMRSAGRPRGMTTAASRDGVTFGGLLGLLPRRRARAAEADAEDEALAAMPELPLPFPDPEADRDLDDAQHALDLRRARPEDGRARPDAAEPEDQRPARGRPARPRPETPRMDPSFAPEASKAARPPEHPLPQRPSRGPAARLEQPAPFPEMEDPLLPFLDPFAPPSATSEPIEARIRRLKGGEAEPEEDMSSRPAPRGRATPMHPPDRRAPRADRDDEEERPLHPPLQPDPHDGSARADHAGPRRQAVQEPRVHHHEQVRAPVWPMAPEEPFLHERPDDHEPQGSPRPHGPAAHVPPHAHAAPGARAHDLGPHPHGRVGDPWTDLESEDDLEGDAPWPSHAAPQGPRREREPVLRGTDRPAPPMAERAASRPPLHLGPFAAPMEPRPPAHPGPWETAEPHRDHGSSRDHGSNRLPQTPPPQAPSATAVSAIRGGAAGGPAAGGPAAPWARRTDSAGWQGYDPFEMMEDEAGESRPRPPEPLRHGPPEQYLPPHLRAEPRLVGQAPGAAPVLSRADVHRLQATLYELSECRRILGDTLEPHGGASAPEE